MNNPYRQSSGIIFLYKYNIITSDRLFLEVLCLLLAVKPKRKMLLFLKMRVTRKIFTRAGKDLVSKCLNFQNSPNENPVKNRIFPNYKIRSPWKILLLRYVIFKDFKLNVLLHASL